MTHVNYPDYLSATFFRDVLASGLSVKSSAVQIASVQLSAGSKSGDNFCSDVYRAVVTYHLEGSATAEESVSLIVKAMPFTEARGQVLEDLAVFDKEVSMYEDTLPRMSQLLGGLKLNAKYYYSSKTPVDIIVFEDLKASGYKMADRTAGIDETHCNLVLETIGKFHAASMVLAEQDPQAMDPYPTGLVTSNAHNNEVMKAVFEKGFTRVLELASSWPGFENIVKRLKTVEEDFLLKMNRHCNHSASDYKVLNHGDTWINNFMFKYDSNGRPVELVLIDFQMCFYSSPGIDLNYFLNTSPQNELRENRRQHMLETYHSTFVRTLRELKSPMAAQLTLERTLSEIRTRELFGFMASLGLLPIILNERDEKLDSSLEAFADAEAGKALQDAMYNNPVYGKAMKFILRRFDELHVFDKVEL